jgi:hypothetical protein
VPPVVSVCDGVYAFEPGTAGGEVKVIEAKCPKLAGE